MSLSAAQVLLLLLPSRSVAFGPGVETIPSTAPSPPACGDVSLFHGGLFFAGVFSLNTIARIAIGRDGQVVATSAVNETDNEPRFSNKNMSLECAAPPMTYVAKKESRGRDGEAKEDNAICMVLPWATSSQLSAHDLKCVETSEVGSWIYHVTKLREDCVVLEMTAEYTEHVNTCNEEEEDTCKQTHPVLVARHLVRVDDGSAALACR